MSDEALRAWVASVARVRGIALEAAEVERLARTVAPTRAAWAELVRDLPADADPYEFRRLLLAESRRG
jgi:hypothetical protein